ncbi:carboxypeptidase regulatory-like domain-containing protein, partial [Candidatus Hydrogenedentota bacterium]
VKRWGCVKGRVVDSGGTPVGKFVASSKAKNGRYTAMSKTFFDGQFDLRNVEPGRVTISVRAENMGEASSDELQIAPGEVVEDVAITLSRGGSISGVVREAQTGESVAGAIVYVAKEIPGREWGLRDIKTKCTTNARGEYEIRDVPPGDLVVFVRASEYGDGVEESVSVLAGRETSDVNFALVAAAVIQGYVYYDEKAVRSARVDFEQSWSMAGTSHGMSESGARTNQDGFYRLGDVDPGERELTCTFMRSGGKRIEVKRKVSVAEGETLDIDFSVISGNSVLRGVVSSEDAGRPVVASVRAELQTPPTEDGEISQTIAYRVSKDKAGRFTITELRPGEYIVSYAGDSKTVTVGEGTTEIELKLSPGGWRRGR